jgi:hypothetical protein
MAATLPEREPEDELAGLVLAQRMRDELCKQLQAAENEAIGGKVRRLLHVLTGADNARRLLCVVTEGAGAVPSPGSASGPGSMAAPLLTRVVRPEQPDTGLHGDITRAGPLLAPAARAGTDLAHDISEGSLDLDTMVVTCLQVLPVLTGKVSKQARRQFIAGFTVAARQVVRAGLRAGEAAEHGGSEGLR